MITYSMNNQPYQSFVVSQSSITISLLWVNDVGWIAGIEGLVDGVRVAPNLPIFRQYGYDNLIFIHANNEISFDDMADVYLVVE